MDVNLTSDAKVKLEPGAKLSFSYEVCFLSAFHVLTNFRLNITSPHCVLEESNFNFRYIRLCDLDIPREKWLKYLQTVATDQTLSSGASDLGLTVSTVCQFRFWGSICWF